MNNLLSKHYALLTLLLVFIFFIDCKKKTATTLINPPVTPVVTVPATTSFVHPGILNTQASLDQIRAELQSGNAQRNAAYNKMMSYVNSTNYSSTFPSIIVVGSNGVTTPSKTQIRVDSELAYATALRWAATGDVTYAQLTLRILNGWAATFQSYGLLDNPASPTNANQPSLEASWTTPTLVAAAEIMKYYKVNDKYAGWADNDVKIFENYLNKVLLVIDKTPVYNNNWNVSAGYAKMSIGVFLNDRATYQAGMDYLKKYISIIISGDGTINELCDRQDCVHFQYSLTGFTYGAEIARIQGDNSIYTSGANVISLGYNFMKKAYDRTTSCLYCTTNSLIYPGVEVAYNYYKTSTLKSLRDLQAPLGIPTDNTFLGFTTYTHYNVSLN